jgi:hypothetical protein
MQPELGASLSKALYPVGAGGDHPVSLTMRSMMAWSRRTHEFPGRVFSLVAFGRTCSGDGEGPAPGALGQTTAS